MNSWIRIRIWILWINELDSEYEFCELVNYNQNQDQNLNSVKRDHRVVQESPVLASASHDITNVAQASVQASELEPHSSHNGMDFFHKKRRINEKLSIVTEKDWFFWNHDLVNTSRPLSSRNHDREERLIFWNHYEHSDFKILILELTEHWQSLRLTRRKEFRMK